MPNPSQGQKLRKSDVWLLFTITSESANRKYLISPSVQLTTLFDVGRYTSHLWQINRESCIREKTLLRTHGLLHNIINLKGEKETKWSYLNGVLL